MEEQVVKYTVMKIIVVFLCPISDCVYTCTRLTQVYVNILYKMYNRRYKLIFISLGYISS